MPQEPPVSLWATQHFGDEAREIRQLVADALAQSQSRAVMIQHMSGLPGKQPFGGMWPKTHQEMENKLRAIPGARRFHPPKAPYNLMVVNNRLLLPFRHADTISKPLTKAKLKTKVAKELSAVLAAAAPAADLFSFLGSDAGALEAPALNRPELLHLDPQTKVIYVPFVSHAHSGLIKAWWGEAGMRPDGTLIWGPELEELPAGQVTDVDTESVLISEQERTIPSPRFYEGDLPPLGFPNESGDVAQ
ncbi:hypothetical protein ACGFIH_02880 [Micromonospora parva]|uniref:hypothetical protein n=1 Tax=Micromonospora parva TaxID=1464048 RepID=UPI003722A207